MNALLAKLEQLVRRFIRWEQGCDIDPDRCR